MTAHYQMLATQTNQSMIVCGESGSGELSLSPGFTSDIHATNRLYVNVVCMIRQN
jgi:hypothetical protein